jgi:hypothetical protein
MCEVGNLLVHLTTIDELLVPEHSQDIHSAPVVLLTELRIRDVPYNQDPGPEIFSSRIPEKILRIRIPDL